MATLRSARRSFNPEALSQIAVIVDDVWSPPAAVEFDVSGGGTRVLYTTRQENLLSHPEIRAQPLRLDAGLMHG